MNRKLFVLNTILVISTLTSLGYILKNQNSVSKKVDRLYKRLCRGTEVYYE